MQCWIYKGSRREETYLYLAQDLAQANDTDQIPEALLGALGTLTFVMELSLSRGRPLARANVEQVILDLSERGYYLQMPPADPQIVERMQ
jgi:uncharacterized protein YcgL (UPF0745 family)